MLLTTIISDILANLSTKRFSFKRSCYLLSMHKQ